MGLDIKIMKANQAFKKNEEAEMNVGSILTVLIIVVVGLALVPTIQDSTNSSRDALGADTAGGNLAELMPLFFVLILVGGTVAFVKFRGS